VCGVGVYIYKQMLHVCLDEKRQKKQRPRDCPSLHRTHTIVSEHFICQDVHPSRSDDPSTSGNGTHAKLLQDGPLPLSRCQHQDLVRSLPLCRLVARPWDCLRELKILIS
jgi:hypothetical protein